ncbi:hypothetical protein ABW20_dc0107431 [Dactylellina cionopaga]|nr:hypothetical protein ABW20_dc0107431 [Dactylellina cionopaga]
MSRRAAQKAFYAKLIPLWPKDPLRPHIEIHKLLASRLESDFGNATPYKHEWEVINDGSKGPPIYTYNPNVASPEKQWGVLASLIGNRYQKKYPVTKLTEPGFNPQYYKTLIEEMDAAPKRNWFTAYLNSWRGFIRWEP